MIYKRANIKGGGLCGARSQKVLKIEGSMSASGIAQSPSLKHSYTRVRACACVRVPPYAMEEALEAILGHKSAHSLATGPVMALPFISPLLLTMTPALSSKYRVTPSLR